MPSTTIRICTLILTPRLYFSLKQTQAYILASLQDMPFYVKIKLAWKKKFQ